jgi:DNA helicase-2/ATP-dependent DNA helicase PcrA
MFFSPNGRILEADDQDMLEEERRLFYVALTRAKDELYLSYCPAPDGTSELTR